MCADLIKHAVPCLECPAGQMHRHYLTYFTWLGEELITVPDFPAWVCDVCGRREYDSSALSRLNLLLIPNAGKPSMPRVVPIRRKTKNARPSQAEG
jgi:YgiT-type zinc finger domain-containing protein